MLEEITETSLKNRVGFKRKPIQDAVAIKAFATANLGSATLLVTMAMNDFYNNSVVSNAEHSIRDEDVAQRNLNLAHARKIAVFVLKALMKQTQKMREEAGEERSKILDDILRVLGSQSYASLPPFICNLRDIKSDLSNVDVSEMTTENKEVACLKIKLRAKDVFHVVDGQHRRHAMKEVLDFLNMACTAKKLKKTSLLAPYQPDNIFEFTEAMAEVLSTARWHSTVQIESHVGLDIKAERQLFHDTNDLNRKMDKALVTAFDTSTPIYNLVTKLSEEDSELICLSDDSFEMNDLLAITSKLLVNRLSAHGVTNAVVSERESLAFNFWQAVNINIENSKKLETNMLYSAGILKALAGLLFSLSFSKTADLEGAGKLIELIKKYNFDLVSNPVFSIQILSNDEIKAANLDFIKERLDTHIKPKNDYTKEDIETKAIMNNQKAHLVKIYSNIFLAILEK